MSARSDSADHYLPAAPPSLRWIVAPAIGWAMLAAFGAMLNKRARRPSVAPMSDEWLRSTEADRGRRQEGI